MLFLDFLKTHIIFKRLKAATSVVAGSSIVPYFLSLYHQGLALPYETRTYILPHRLFENRLNEIILLGTLEMLHRC